MAQLQPPTSEKTATDPVALLGLFLLLVPWLLRATTNATTLPAWDLDPLSYPVFSTSLTPAGSLLCDGASILGSALLLLRSARRGTSLNLPLLLLALIGAVAIVLHGWFLGTAQGSLGNQRIGAAWLGAIFGAVALWHAAQDLGTRRIATGSLMGLIALLALYGAVQVFWVHAQTVADFQSDPDRMLAAHGWSKDSPMAKSFIRRLMQPEAIGWFGLSNVYGSFAAAAVVGCVGLLIAERRKGRRQTLAMAAFVLIGLAALGLSKSKGGIIAAGAGGLALAAFYGLSASERPLPHAKRRLAGFLGLAAIVGPIVLIIIRGQFGVRLGELSLLFRWFYIEAATRIFVDHPLVGVGPDGFQQAFTLAKPPLCPEEVSSPHGVVFDWSATLGVFGFAWVCILGRLAWQAAASAFGPSTAHQPAAAPMPRAEVRTMLAIIAAATLLAALLESALVTPEIALTRVVGVVLWCLVSWVIAKVIDNGPACRIALASAALALIAHAQIDVTASLPSSAGLWLALIALAAAPTASNEAPARVVPIGAHILASASFAGAAILILATGFRSVRAWENQLFAAAETVRPIADITERFSALSSRTGGADSLQAIVRDLERQISHPVAPSPDGFRAGMAELERRILPPAADELEAAFGLEPSDRRPLRESSRLHLRLAEQAKAVANDSIASAELEKAVQVLRLDPSIAVGPAAAPSASDWHWLASIHEHSAELLKDPARVSRAIDARLRIAAIDPYNLENAKRLLRDYQAINDSSQAKAWAARCLELNDFMRLDRETRGLSMEELRDIAGIAKASD